MQPSFIVCCLLHWFKTKHMQTLGILKGSLWKVRKVSCNLLGSIDPATVTRLNGKQAPEPRWEWGATTTEFCSDSQDLLSRCRSRSVKMPMFSQTMQRFFFGIVWEDWYVYFCIDETYIYIYTLFRFAFHLCIRIYLNLEIFNWKTGMQDGYSMVRFGNVSQWTLLTASESLDNAHE